MIYRGTTTEVVLKILLYKTLSFKDVEKSVRKHKTCNKSSSLTIQNILYRLKKKNLVTKTKTGWSANQLAKSTLAGRSEFNKNNFQTRNKKKVSMDKMIVMYDIPENLRKKRENLREGLKILNFKQKQKSVWIGPAPLPKEFVDYLNELKIVEYINFFQVREKDII